MISDTASNFDENKVSVQSKLQVVNEVVNSEYPFSDIYNSKLMSHSNHYTTNPIDLSSKIIIAYNQQANVRVLSHCTPYR